METPPDWPFEDPPNVAVSTTQAVLDGEWIALVTIDAEDGDWQFHSKAEPDEANARVVALRRVVDIDPSLRELADGLVRMARRAARSVAASNERLRERDMFSHVMLGCSDRERSKKFYDATLGALGFKPGQDFGKSDWWGNRDASLGIGPPLDGQACSHGNGSTIGFKASSPEAVDAWHAAGVANGGTSIEDPPGIRDAGFGKMYLAYLRDPDGNKLCGFYKIPEEK